MRRIGEGSARFGFSLRRAVQGFRLNPPERLLIAPQELEPGDPSAAIAFYSGHIMLAGRTVQTRGQSPFRIEPPNSAWARELHGFSWLRHFRDADNHVVRHHARALIAEWLSYRDLRSDPVVRHPAVVADRMLAWLIHAPLLLSDADHGYYQRFMRSLARDAQWLEYSAKRRSLGLTRLSAAIAYASFTLCALTHENDWKKASQLLAEALKDLILADGTPASRNPADALRLAAELLQLRTAYTARGRTPPPELQTALDRIMSFLRLMRHPDGALALFNGMGSSRLVLIGAILAFDDSAAGPPASARFGGYHRLERGDAMVLVDAGPAPPVQSSEAAHAGALSFEFSTGRERLIVNCGAAPPGLDDLREALRETAAQSTVTVADTSSARFVTIRASDGAIRRHMIDPGDRPTIERDANDAGEALELSHSGYTKSHGLIHRRSLLLAADGGRLAGTDQLEPVGRKVPGTAPEAIVRLHLHPRVQPFLAIDGTSVRLEMPDGALWTFEAGGTLIGLDESIFLGGLSSQRRAMQIVITMPPPGEVLRWSFVRRAAPKV